MSGVSGPDAAALETVLRGEGFACRVEARDRLAILVPDQASDAGTPDAGAPNATSGLVLRAARERALGLARAHGFTHVALELPPVPTLAPAPGAGISRP